MGERTDETAPSPAAAGDVGATPGRVSMHYIKSSSFRLIHADGALGGMTPDGKGVHMTLFNQRQPIPQRTVHSVADDGELVEDPALRVARDGIVREVEVGVVMDIDTARQLRDWLDGWVGRLHELGQGRDDAPTKGAE